MKLTQQQPCQLPISHVRNGDAFLLNASTLCLKLNNNEFIAVEEGEICNIVDNTQMVSAVCIVEVIYKPQGFFEEY